MKNDQGILTINQIDHFFDILSNLFKALDMKSVVEELDKTKINTNNVEAVSRAIYNMTNSLCKLYVSNSTHMEYHVSKQNKLITETEPRNQTLILNDTPPDIGAKLSQNILNNPVTVNEIPETSFNKCVIKKAYDYFNEETFNKLNNTIAYSPNTDLNINTIYSKINQCGLNSHFPSPRQDHHVHKINSSNHKHDGLNCLSQLTTIQSPLCPVTKLNSEMIESKSNIVNSTSEKNDDELRHMTSNEKYFSIESIHSPNVNMVSVPVADEIKVLSNKSNQIVKLDSNTQVMCESNPDTFFQPEKNYESDEIIEPNNYIDSLPYYLSKEITSEEILRKKYIKEMSNKLKSNSLTFHTNGYSSNYTFYFYSVSQPSHHQNLLSKNLGPSSFYLQSPRHIYDQVVPSNGLYLKNVADFGNFEENISTLEETNVSEKIKDDRNDELLQIVDLQSEDNYSNTSHDKRNNVSLSSSVINDPLLINPNESSLENNESSNLTYVQHNKVQSDIDESIDNRCIYQSPCFGLQEQIPGKANSHHKMESYIQCLTTDEFNWSQQYDNGDFHTYNLKKEELYKQNNHSIKYMVTLDHFYPYAIDPYTTYDFFNLKIIYERRKTNIDFEFQFKNGAVVAGRYVILRKIDEAAFSLTFRCYDRLYKKLVCMKLIRNDKHYIDQCLNEIQILRLLMANDSEKKYSFVDLYDFFYFRGHLILITELLNNNLYEIAKAYTESGNKFYTLGIIQIITYQLLNTLSYVHSLGIIHADLKPENILIESFEYNTIKLIDFGSSSFEADILPTYAQSRFYRAPEIILGLPYDTKVDLWSLGCIIVELLTGTVIFQSTSHSDLLSRIVSYLGPLPYYMINKGIYSCNYFTKDGVIFEIIEQQDYYYTEDNKKLKLYFPRQCSLQEFLKTDDGFFLDFVYQLLKIDPAKRMSASEALTHPWICNHLYSDGL